MMNYELIQAALTTAFIVVAITGLTGMIVHNLCYFLCAELLTHPDLSRLSRLSRRQWRRR